MHRQMSVHESLKLSKCPRLTHVCGLSDLLFRRCWIILVCPALLLSSDKRPRVNCPPLPELDRSGLLVDHTSNSLMELPLSIEINAEPLQTKDMTLVLC